MKGNFYLDIVTSNKGKVTKKVLLKSIEKRNFFTDILSIPDPDSFVKRRCSKTGHAWAKSNISNQ